MAIDCTRSHPHELMDDVCQEKKESARPRAEITALKARQGEPVAWGLQMPGEPQPRQIWLVKDSAFENAMKRWPEAYEGAYQVPLYLASSNTEALRQDAERWKYWRDKYEVNTVITIFGNGCVNKTIEMAEAAIDAELGGKP